MCDATITLKCEIEMDHLLHEAVVVNEVVPVRTPRRNRVYWEQETHEPLDDTQGNLPPELWADTSPQAFCPGITGDLPR